jgi:hypothetical protein
MAAHPLWSLICDVRMFRLWVGGRLDAAFAAIDDAQRLLEQRYADAEQNEQDQPDVDCNGRVEGDPKAVG